LLIGGIFMRRVLGWVAMAIALTGCASQGPGNQYFPYARQKEMFSPSHWKILAIQTATELRQRWPAGPTRLQLEDDADSPFSHSFDLFLAEELARRNIFVNDEMVRGESKVQSGRKLRVHVEVVTHEGGPPADPLAFTFLGGATGLGVWLAESAPLMAAVDSLPPIGAGAGLAIDAKRALLPDATSTEVVVSTAIIDDGYETGGKTDVFYVQTINRGEYAATPGHWVEVRGR
jgi:hypothetical protein